MADYLLDTNILSYWYDTRCSEHARVVAAVSAATRPDPQSEYVSRLYISTVTLGEVEYGHRVALSPDLRKQTDYIKFIRDQCPVVLDLTQHVAEQFGRIKAWLFATGRKSLRSRVHRYNQLKDPISGEALGIDENDLWVAAHAMTLGLVLVTHDRDFDRLRVQFASSLRVEDWAEQPDVP